jgi:6-pyruvoyltetrahydropterin/6-carboxytetrahydropterin synthase
MNRIGKMNRKEEGSPMLIKRKFTFDAAHNLTCYHGKCEQLHGHTYTMVVTLKGMPGDEGMIMDFLQIKSLVNEKVIQKLDHSYINDIIPQPTAENIAVWVWKQIAEEVEKDSCILWEVEIWETPRNGVVLSREDMQ